MPNKINTTKANLPTLLIIKHFYKLKAAEHEVVERLVEATKEIGWIPKVVEVDMDFKYKKIHKFEKDIDAVLDIHYEYPKFFKAKSYGAFWTPTEFMTDWDLAYVFENQLSHDRMIHTDSKKILELLSKFRPNEKFGILNHSLPLSWIQWINSSERAETTRAFYAGINWNKFSGRPGRHHNFFKLIDDLDIMDIYGPKRIAHIVPWKGFKSYRGEIPFDGRSILLKTRRSGVSLVLSSEQHISEGIISSRFFEGIASGNAIISDGHPFIRKYLGRKGLYLNFERGDMYATNQIIEYMDELRNNSSLLYSLQEYSQNLFSEKFDLTKQLKRIIDSKNNIPMMPYIDALIIGKSKNHIKMQLESLGFKRIIHFEGNIKDLQDLHTLAQSFQLNKFCIFVSTTEVLDGFIPALLNIEKTMKTQDSQLGIIPTVALSQDGGKFSPAIVDYSHSLPLNGLVVNRNFGKLSVSIPLSKVPYLRVRKVQDIKYISRFSNSFKFLLNVDVDSELNSNSNIRQLVLNTLKGSRFSYRSDVVQEIISLPRTRRRLLGYTLIAALPIMKPFVRILRLFIRR